MHKRQLVTYSGISKRTAKGRLHRKYPGVYAVGQPRLSQQGEWIAATLACGHGAYLASLNAAVHTKLLAPPSHGHPRAHVGTADRTPRDRARDTT